MKIRASALTLATFAELPPGALFTIDGHWYLRIDFNDLGASDIQPAAILLSKEVKFEWLSDDAKCLALAEGYRYELRINGPIKGLGRPDIASLFWLRDGSLAVSTDRGFFAFTGVETTDVGIRAGTFFAPQWGAWLLDATGKEVSPDPLFVIGAH
ncbi:hypothetical protein LN572_04420 [Xanthomonas citri pv. fuscans]|uniref:hypothetical protein n=1 Tax=Xanthomonas citri TaxID=346 RepID=UPI001E499FF9|nr:hypothetical protein [Xanthomonas citri]MCC8489115.1 hypothetical protein [Xanthomonas citri pv. fuscans]